MTFHMGTDLPKLPQRYVDRHWSIVTLCYVWGAPEPWVVNAAHESGIVVRDTGTSIDDVMRKLGERLDRHFTDLP